MVVAWHGTARHVMCESKTAALCKSKGKDKSNPLAERHGMGKALEWHGVCELAFNASRFA
jgi:hypothetical protein